VFKLYIRRQNWFLMKNVNTVLNVICLLAIAVLFFLFFKSASPAKTNTVNKSDSSKSSIASIAYFEMDTVERRYNYIKDVQDQLKGRQAAISNELNATKKNYMNRIQQLQGKAATMSQQEGEAAQAEINQMQNELQQKEARLSQELQEQQFKLMQDINKKIEDYLQTYNKEKKYAYILSHSPGDFIYFKDSSNNITEELVKGLNDGYKKTP
jgi:outer membrane protein